MSKKIVSEWGSFPNQRAFWKLSVVGGVFAIAIILALTIAPTASASGNGTADQSAVEFIAHD